MKFAALRAHAVVEWVLCVPVLIALVGFVFGVLLLALQQLQLERAAARIADALSHSNLTDDALLQQQAQLIARHQLPFGVAVDLDRHWVDENAALNPSAAPRIDVIGVEVTHAPLRLPGLRLRAYARAPRIR